MADGARRNGTENPKPETRKGERFIHRSPGERPPGTSPRGTFPRGTSLVFPELVPQGDVERWISIQLGVWLESCPFNNGYLDGME